MRLPLKLSAPRLAVVRDSRHPDSVENSGETLTLSPDSASFSSDGLTFAFDSGAGALRDGDIITVNEYGLVSKLFDTEERDATVYLTGMCNSNCVMCPTSDYERKNYRGMPDEWMTRYLDALPADIEHITVTGGEPTMRTELFFQVMSRLAERFPETETLLLTNGRSFASRRMTERLLSMCPQYLTAAIPLHGHNSELHDAITRADGSFRQTCMGIRRLLAEGVSVEVRVVVSARNCRALSDVAAFIVKEFPNVLIVNFIGLETLGNCVKYFPTVYIDYAESFLCVKTAVNILADAGIDVSLYNYPLCTVERGYWSLCRRSISPHKVRYAPECECCAVKRLCGGWFRSTLAVAKPTVCPVIQEKLPC